MKIFHHWMAVAAITMLAMACQPNGRDGSTTNANGCNSAPEAKYLFYFIGDGMTASQVRLAEAALTSERFQNNFALQSGVTTAVDRLHLKSLEVTGLATSNAQNRYITDSAAAGTALATGSKTDVGVISQSPDGATLRTLAEMAKAKGMKVGIVSSVSIDHATPACFYAHAASRSEYSQISDQLLTSGFDYFGGGSVKWSSRAKAEGTDAATAYTTYKARAEQQGFKYVTTKAEFDAVGKGEQQPVIATLDMLANEQYGGDGFAMPYTIDLSKQKSDDNKISLADFTQKGIDLMEGEEGFFMMVEGGKIDWACHANDAATAAYEVVAFDQAIGVAMAFAQRHPEETLIVVTGDHDCGGLSIGFGGTGYDSAFELLANSTTSSVEFTTAVSERIAKGESFDQLLAFACQSFGFTNNEVGEKVKTLAAAELSDYEVAKLRQAYTDSKNPSKERNMEYGHYDPFTVTCTHLLNNKAGVDYTSFSHTAVPVMVFAEGARQELFSGYYDNTDIAKKIMKAAGLK